MVRMSWCSADHILFTNDLEIEAGITGLGRRAATPHVATVTTLTNALGLN